MPQSLPENEKPIIDYIIEKIPKENNEIIIVSSGKFYNNFLEWNKNRFKIINDNTFKNWAKLAVIVHQFIFFFLYGRIVTKLFSPIISIASYLHAR